MISCIIQALFNQISAQYKWAWKEMTKNLWYTLRQKQREELFKENGEWMIDEKMKAF